MLQRILVQIDESPVTKEALPYAWELADKFGAELILTWVTQLPLPVRFAEFGVFSHYDKEVQAQLADDARTYLRSLQRESVGYQVRSRIAVLIGYSAITMTANFAKQERVDLIVKSMRERSRVSRWFFGSMAAQLLQYTPCPVYLIRV